MSRISFTTEQGRWHVGWDPAVASYYAQVEPPRLRGRGDVDDPPVTVVGERVGEVQTVADLDRRLAGRVQLPDGVREHLAGDDGPATPAAGRLPGLEERELAQRWAALSGAGADGQQAKEQAKEQVEEPEARRRGPAQREDDVRWAAGRREDEVQRSEPGRGPHL